MQTKMLQVCVERSPKKKQKKTDILHSINLTTTDGCKKRMQAFYLVYLYSSSDPIIHEVRVRRDLHKGNGVKDVVNVVA